MQHSYMMEAVRVTNDIVGCACPARRRRSAGADDEEAGGHHETDSRFY